MVPLKIPTATIPPPLQYIEYPRSWPVLPAIFASIQFPFAAFNLATTMSVEVPPIPFFVIEVPKYEDAVALVSPMIYTSLLPSALVGETKMSSQASSFSTVPA